MDMNAIIDTLSPILLKDFLTMQRIVLHATSLRIIEMTWVE
jgi:hypothetical protein